MIEMGYEENDESVIPDIEEMMEEFKADFEHIRIKTLLSGEYDKDNAIVTLHAGAGGTESCDWGSTLYRMYFTVDMLCTLLPCCLYAHEQQLNPSPSR